MRIGWLERWLRRTINFVSRYRSGLAAPITHIAIAYCTIARVLCIKLFTRCSPTNNIEQNHHRTSTNPPRQHPLLACRYLYNNTPTLLPIIPPPHTHSVLSTYSTLLQPYLTINTLSESLSDPLGSFLRPYPPLTHILGRVPWRSLRRKALWTLLHIQKITGRYGSFWNGPCLLKIRIRVKNIYYIFKYLYIRRVIYYA